MICSAFGITHRPSRLPGDARGVPRPLRATTSASTRGSFPGMDELLDGLEARGDRLGRGHQQVRALRAPAASTRWASARAPRVIVGGDTCARAKPFPDPLLFAAERLGRRAGARALRRRRRARRAGRARRRHAGARRGLRLPRRRPAAGAVGRRRASSTRARGSRRVDSPRDALRARSGARCSCSALAALRPSRCAPRAAAAPRPRAAAPARPGLPLRRQRRLQHVGAVHRPLYYSVRPTIAVPRDAVLKVTDRHGFHPSLAPLVPAWEAQRARARAGHRLRATARSSTIATARSRSPAERRRSSSREGWVTRALARRARDAARSPTPSPSTCSTSARPIRWARSAATAGRRAGALRRRAAREAPHRRLRARRRTRAGASASRAADGDARAGRAARPRFPDDPFGAGDARRGGARRGATARCPVIHVALNGLDGDKHHSVDCHWDQLEVPRRRAAAPRRGPRGAARGPDRDRPLGRDARRDLRRVRPLADGERATTARTTASRHTHFVHGRARAAAASTARRPRCRRSGPIGGPAPVDRHAPAVVDGRVALVGRGPSRRLRARLSARFRLLRG